MGDCFGTSIGHLMLLLHSLVVHRSHVFLHGIVQSSSAVVDEPAVRRKSVGKLKEDGVLMPLL